MMANSSNQLKNSIEYLNTLQSAFEFTAKLISFPPSRELVITLQDAKILAMLNSLEETDLSEKVGRIFRDLKSIFHQLSTNNSEVIYKQLSTEYTRLFLGLRRNMNPFPPCESLFRGQSRLMMGDPAREVARIYFENGFILPKNFKNPPDHLGAELIFIAYLLSKQAQATQDKNPSEQQKLAKIAEQFIKEHLGTWINQFCKVLFDYKPHPFYKAILELISCLLEEDWKIKN